jgi:hypothetical protein
LSWWPARAYLLRRNLRPFRYFSKLVQELKGKDDEKGERL